MKKLLTALRYGLSYVLPIRRRYVSAYSGILEVVLHKGVKVLNTANANYSYGSLERVLRYGLLFAPASPTEPALVLGLGGGSVVQLLRQEQKLTAPVVAVELDPVVIRVAAEEFGIRADATLQIVCADAFAWVAAAPARAYGLVVVDIFLDLDLPAELHEGQFWQHLYRLLQPGGYALVNLLVGAELWPDGQPLTAYLAGLGLTVKELEVEEFNWLLVLYKPAA